MHFVCGGAFQGKRKWVVETYQLLTKESCCWISGYNDETSEIKEGFSIVVIEGIEALIKKSIDHCVDHQLRSLWQEKITQWLNWENESEENLVILIGTDITQGLVPVEKTERLWRDIVGWCYQDIVQQSIRVDRIWCGISERIK
ncbi:bifunctional adenosylcobinamide kinase/adenosylcobinamide-phosphate guanylyltransferase [Cytobacillus sp. Hm23]